MNRFEQKPDPVNDKRWLQERLAQTEQRLARTDDDHDRHTLMDTKRVLLRKIDDAERRMAA